MIESNQLMIKILKGHVNFQVKVHIDNGDSHVKLVRIRKHLVQIKFAEDYYHNHWNISSDEYDTILTVLKNGYIRSGNATVHLISIDGDNDAKYD